MADVGLHIAPRRKTVRDPKRIGLWEIGRTIGTGSSGRVKIARHSKTGQHAAIKIISKVALNSRISLNHLVDETEHSRLAIEREIVVMKLIDHPNIMRLYDVWETSTELFLILEYVQGGELFDYLCQKGKLPLPEALNYFQQIICAVDYCHRFNIAHRDLKPENILLDKDFNIKIADFGMAAWQVNDRNGMLRTACGSPHYAAPEIINGETYKGSAADTWSCGIILYALLTGKLPFDHEDCGVLLNLVKMGKYDIPSDVDPQAQNLIRRILIMDPTQRITMSEIMEHPFFNLYEPKINNPSLPNIIDIARPIENRALIDPDTFANLRALWHDTPDQELTESLLSNEPTWQKGVYHLLVRYRSKHSNAYHEEEEKITQDRIERRKSKKAKSEVALERAFENVELEPSPSSLPPRNDPPTPRRAAGRGRTSPMISDRSICDRNVVAPAISLKSPSPSSTPSPPNWDRLESLTVPELLDDKMEAFFRQIVHHLNSLEARTASPNIGLPSSSSGGYSPNAILAPPPTPTSVVFPLPVNSPEVRSDACISETFASLHQGGVRPLSVRRKSRLVQPHADDNLSNKENLHQDEWLMINEGPRVVNQPPLKIDGGRTINVDKKQVRIDEHIERREPKLVKKRNKRVTSLPWSDIGSSVLTSPPAFSLPPFTSSKRTWFGHVFNFRPPTLSLLSVRDVQTTRSECRRLLMGMNVRVMLEDVSGLGVLRCRLDEVKEPSGIMNVLKAVKFRVTFQQQQTCGQERQELCISLTVIHEKGSVETFREICRRLEQNWTIDIVDSPLETRGVANMFTEIYDV